MASPMHLRAAADELRRTAAAIDADVAGVTDAGDTETWVGPAATRYRLVASRNEARAGDVGVALRTLADGLDTRAVHLERVEALERAEERARERERARARAGAGSGPPCDALGPLHSWCSPAPARTRGRG